MSRREKKVQSEENDDGVGLGFDEKEERDEKKAPGRRQPAFPSPSANMPAPLLAPLFKIEIHVRWIGSELKLYAALINHYPYVLTVKARQRFDEYQQKYQRDVKQFQSLSAQIMNSGAPVERKDSKGFNDPAEAARKLLKRCTAMHRHLQQYLSDRLQMICEDFRDEASECLVMIIRTLRSNLSQPDLIMPPTALTLNTPLIRKQSLALEQQTSRVLEQWQTGLSSLQQQRHSWDWSITMRWRQHTVAAIQSRLQNISDLWADAPLNIPLPSQRLTAEQCRDLNVLSALLKPAAILPALERKAALLLAHYQDLQNRIRVLQQKLSQREGAAAVRELRLVLAYEHWRSHLQSLNAPSGSSPSAWEQVVKVQRRLTIEKKAFFKQYFQQQPADAVIARLEMGVKSHPVIQSLLPALRREKDILIARVAADEAKRVAGQTVWQRLAATAWLSLAQQPDYQLGELAFLSGVQQMDRLPKHLPVLSEPLPEPMKQRWASYTGLTFLTIGLSVSQYAGYYAHAISAINRVLSAQITAWFRIGNACDRVLSQGVMPLLERVTRKPWVLPPALRCDEIGLLEHDRQIQWVNGLVINGLLMPAQPWLFTVMGYSVASASGEAALYWLDQFARIGKIELESSHFIKVAVHLAVYSQAYRQGVQWAAILAPPRPPVQMTSAEALQHFGLFQPPSTGQEIKKHYRQLSRRYHPDKCRGDDCQKCDHSNGATQ